MKVHPYRFLKYCTTLLVLLLLVTNCEQEHEVVTLAQNNNDFEIRKIEHDWTRIGTGMIWISDPVITPNQLKSEK